MRAHLNHGVVHASGALDDLLLRSMTAKHLTSAFAPKAIAAAHLHAASPVDILSAFVCLSSIVALLGNVGQANYAAANSYLDGLAQYRSSAAAEACSLQLPLVAGSTMATGIHVQTTLLTLDEFARSLACMMWACIPAPRTLLSLPPYTSLKASAPSVANAVLLSELVGTETGEHQAPEWHGDVASATQRVHAAANAHRVERQAGTEATVMRVIREVSGGAGTSLTLDVPLLEAGVDSLAATELSSRLGQRTGLQLSPMLLFEQPTARAVVAHILANIVDDFESGLSSPCSALGAVTHAAPVDSAHQLLGSAGKWPGSVSAHATYQQLLLAGGVAKHDAVWRRWSSKMQMPAGLDLSAYAGLLAGIELIDTAAFGLAPAEVDAMDPQQRILLEAGYEALHDAWLRRAQLLGSEMAVQIGIDHLDWQTMQQGRRLTQPGASLSVYSGPGEHANIASGRLSFILGLHGSSICFNTACSSSLVALRGGIAAMSTGECVGALVAGTRAILLPFHWAICTPETVGASLLMCAPMATVDPRVWGRHMLAMVLLMSSVGAPCVQAGGAPA
jgi:acyl carrier protein